MTLFGHHLNFIARALATTTLYVVVLNAAFFAGDTALQLAEAVVKREPARPVKQSMTNQSPLILTLQLDPVAFAFFNNLRKQHFPASINYLDAHVTLFHHLPPVAAITDLLTTVTARQPVISLAVTEVMKLGRGVAYRLQSRDLQQLQTYLKQQWQPWLTPQDRQGFRPHVTVQNKVDAATADALFAELTTSFQPFAAEGIGLSLWEYRGGPWHHLQDYPL